MLSNDSVGNPEIPDVLLIGNLVACVGMEPKTVRFYEKVGLIKPQRLGNFRVYNSRDVELLKVIKFLRSLDMSIRIIKRLLEAHGRLRLDNLPEDAKEAVCLQLRRREEEYQRLEQMCRPILMRSAGDSDNVISNSENDDGKTELDT